MFGCTGGGGERGTADWAGHCPELALAQEGSSLVCAAGGGAGGPGRGEAPCDQDGSPGGRGGARGGSGARGIGAPGWVHI